MAELESSHIPEAAKKLLDEGNWQAASQVLEEALKTFPQDLSLLREQANTLLAMQEPQKAYGASMILHPADTP